MKRMFWLSITILLAHSAIAADAFDYATLASSARTLDATSRESLGVSLRALCVLLKASERSFQPVWAPEKNDDLELIDELEAKDYAVVRRISGLPDGTDTGTVYVNYTATDKGRAVISAITGGSAK